MKRIPFIVAGLTGVLLTICFVEYGCRGLNPDLEWDLHPAWWKSDLLANGGMYIRLGGALASSPFERLLNTSLNLCHLFELLIIALLSLIVFYLTRLLFRVLRCSCFAS
jgi:hypothetical protein